jgi:hypothetical protein
MIEINLLPWREAGRSHLFKIFGLIYILIPAIVLIFLLIMHYYLFYQSTVIANRVKDLEIQLTQKTKTPVTLISLDDGVIKTKMQHQKIAVDILNKLFHAPLLGLSIQSVTQKDKVMLVTGQAMAMDSIQRLMSSLVIVKKVQAIKLDSVKRDMQTLRFQISIIEMEES